MHFIHNIRTIAFPGARGKGSSAAFRRIVPSIIENLWKCVLPFVEKVYPRRDGLSCVQTAFNGNQYFANASRKVLRLTVRPLQCNVVCRVAAKSEKSNTLTVERKPRPVGSTASSIIVFIKCNKHMITVY